MTILTRIAPTPSGYLHLGNTYNFILTFLCTKLKKGNLYLRIDDYDQGRMRDEYLEDVFETLDWLKITWDQGPKNHRDFLKNYSSLHRLKDYREALSKLPQQFVCECSRKTIEENSKDGLYPGLCYDKNIDFIPKKQSIRTRYQGSLGDFVVWTKEDFPSYQLASVIDDENLGINFIVRGMDLKDSTEAQKFLARELSLSTFTESKIIHHPLLTKDGMKISKSEGDTSIKELRNQGYQPEDILNGFSDFFKLDVNGKLNYESLADAIKDQGLLESLH